MSEWVTRFFASIFVRRVCLRVQFLSAVNGGNTFGFRLAVYMEAGGFNCNHIFEHTVLPPVLQMALSARRVLCADEQGVAVRNKG